MHSSEAEIALRRPTGREDDDAGSAEPPRLEVHGAGGGGPPAAPEVGGEAGTPETEGGGLRNALTELRGRIRRTVRARGAARADATWRHLALQLHHGADRDGLHRSVLLTTPGDRDVSGALGARAADALASELGRRILLVDLSEDRETERLLGIEAGRGFTEAAVEPSIDVEELALSTTSPSVSVLRRGSIPDRELFDLGEAELLRPFAPWDFTVLAGGSVLTNGLALTLAPVVGQVLLVVSETRTSLERIEQAQSTLSLRTRARTPLVVVERGGLLR